MKKYRIILSTMLITALASLSISANAHDADNSDLTTSNYKIVGPTEFEMYSNKLYYKIPENHQGEYYVSDKNGRIHLNRDVNYDSTELCRCADVYTLITYDVEHNGVVYTNKVVRFTDNKELSERNKD